MAKSETSTEAREEITMADEIEPFDDDVDRCACGAFVDDPDLAEWCTDCGSMFCGPRCYADHICVEAVEEGLWE